MSGKKPKKDFPNNWKEWKQMDDKDLYCPTWDEFEDWKLCSWELPDNIACIIREDNPDTGKVKEFVYKNVTSARKKLDKMMSNSNSSISVCTHDDLHYIYKEDQDDN